tara:strand:- start:781 stop:924 length:144 start_codon:yes stop_codon:yes gene_type:complete
LNGWANTCDNQNGSGEKSGESGGDMVLNICIDHFEIPCCLNGPSQFL